MGWQAIAGDTDIDEFTGDLPWDIFGGALSGAMPTEPWASVAEHAAAFREVLLARGYAPEQVEAQLKPLISPPPAQSKRPPKPKTGDILALPFRKTASAYVLVLYGGARSEPKGPGYGVCIQVLDREVAEGDDLDEVLTTRPLLRPLHPGSGFAELGTTRVGTFPAEEAYRRLPYFGSRTPKGERLCRSYFGELLEPTPENIARECESAVGGARQIVAALRGLRGLELWCPWYASALADGIQPPGGIRE